MWRFLLILLPLCFYAVAPSSPYREPYEFYISGDGFRAYADFVWDEEETFSPAAVFQGAVVFVKISNMESFFSQAHPFIEPSYILITHNGDESAPGKFASFLDDPKILAWFTINLEGKGHPKLHPVPLGIANRYTHPLAGDMMDKVREKKGQKEHLLYFNLTIQNYLPERWEVFQLLGRASFCYKSHRKRLDHYLLDVAASQFVLSPRGVGLDTHRLWESLYLGSYPIVKSSSLDGVYEGLPVLVVQDWKEVNPDFLKSKFEELTQSSYEKERLSMEYWRKKIDSYKTP